MDLGNCAAVLCLYQKVRHRIHSGYLPDCRAGCLTMSIALLVKFELLLFLKIRHFGSPGPMTFSSVLRRSSQLKVAKSKLKIETAPFMHTSLAAPGQCLQGTIPPHLHHERPAFYSASLYRLRSIVSSDHHKAFCTCLSALDQASTQGSRSNIIRRIANPFCSIQHGNAAMLNKLPLASQASQSLADGVL